MDPLRLVTGQNFTQIRDRMKLPEHQSIMDRTSNPAS